MPTPDANLANSIRLRGYGRRTARYVSLFHLDGFFLANSLEQLAMTCQLVLILSILRCRTGCRGVPCTGGMAARHHGAGPAQSCGSFCAASNIWHGKCLQRRTSRSVQRKAAVSSRQRPEIAQPALPPPLQGSGLWHGRGPGCFLLSGGGVAPTIPGDLPCNAATSSPAPVR